MKPQKKSTGAKSKAGASRTPRPAGKKKTSTTSRAASRKSPTTAARQSSDEPSPKPQASSEGKAARPGKGGSRKSPLKVPTILLEGDASPTPPKGGGPGSRYTLTSEAPLPHAGPEAELPESYGTGQLFLAARDPHWLYASWDLAREEQNRCNRMSREGHLVLRVYRGGEEATATPEVHVHPESRNWFAYVPDPATRYYAVLGYYDRAGDWNEVARSRSTLTPPDAPSEDSQAEFATIPPHVTFRDLQRAVKGYVAENLSQVQGILKAVGKEIGQQGAQSEKQKPWPVAKAAEIAKLVTIDNLRRVWMGSLEITELIRRRLQEEVSSGAAPSFGMPLGEAISSISSPAGGAPGKPRQFWFNINAELVIYGATEPGATVTVGGQPITLRPDGSFSFRFSLPDGDYELPAEATSPDGVESREARLQFRRASAYRGSVEPHPQDKTLKPPRAESLRRR